MPVQLTAADFGGWISCEVRKAVEVRRAFTRRSATKLRIHLSHGIKMGVQRAIPTFIYEKLRKLGRYRVLKEVLDVIDAELDLPQSHNELIEGYLARQPHVMWRRALPYEQLPGFASITDLGPPNDNGLNAYDMVLIYRLLNEDELLALRRSAL